MTVPAELSREEIAKVKAVRCRCRFNAPEEGPCDICRVCDMALALDAKEDAARYRWLRNHVSGAEYRRLGIDYGFIDEVDSLIDARKETER